MADRYEIKLPALQVRQGGRFIYCFAIDGKALLDFTAVAYIDSSGLATLIEYYQSARSFSGKFALCSLSSRVRSSFDLMRLSEVFSIFADQPSAQKYLTGGTP